jgi:dTDP-glucose 4,6-dehydratase
VIPLFVTNLILGQKLPIYGNGKNIRDWLHVEDHCHGIELVLQGGRDGEIYNIGGGTELENIELANSILNQFNLGPDWVEYVADRLGHDTRYSVDIAKIEKELGYKPSIPFSDGLSSTIEFYKEKQTWW